MTLRAMARMMNLSAAFVSAVETGKKVPPENFVEDVARAIGMTDLEKVNLNAAVGKVKKSVTVRLPRRDHETAQLALAFARRFPELSEEQKRLIREILN